MGLKIISFSCQSLNFNLEYERAEREKFFVQNVNSRIFWQFDPAQPSVSCEPYVSATMAYIGLYLGNYASHHFETKIKGCAFF